MSPLSSQLREALAHLASEHAERAQAIEWLGARENIARDSVIKQAGAAGPLLGVLGAIEVLGIWQNEKDLPLLVRLAQSDDSRDWGAIKALMHYQSETAYQAVRDLTHQSDETRAGYAVIALTEMGQEKVVPDLVALLQEGSANLRFQALRGLQKLQQLPSESDLKKLKKTETDPDILDLLREIERKR